MFVETEPTAYANCSSGPTGDNSADLYMNVGESSAPRTDKVRERANVWSCFNSLAVALVALVQNWDIVSAQS